MRLRMKRIKIRRISGLLVLMSFFLLFSNVFAAKFFRWVDASGKVHYSYTLPPVTAQQGYTKINETGRQIEVISAPVESTETEEDDTTVEKTESEKEAEEQAKKYDNYLLSTYLSIDELAEAYAKKQKILNDQVDLYNQRIEKLNKELVKAQEQEKNTKKKTDKAKLKDYISATTGSVAVYKEMIHDNQQKLEKLDAVYQSDKARLTQLLATVEDKEKVVSQ